MSHRTAAALLLGCLASAWAATTPAEVEEDHSLATTLVTPHQDWARGHVAGPIKALFFLYAGSYGGEWDEPGTRLREVVELGQRFDLQADAVYFASGGGGWSFHGGKLGEERAERLLEQPYQLYVISGFPFQQLSARMRYEILAQVVKGAGLIYINGGPCEYLSDARKTTPTPEALTAGLPRLDGKSAADWVAAYKLRDGRAAWLRYAPWGLTPSREFSWRGLTDYDYWMLLVGRTALWAAGKQSRVQLTSVLGNQPLEVKRDAKAAAEVVLSSAEREPVPVTVSLALRRAADGLRTPLPEQTAAPAIGKPATLTVPLPKLRADEYYLDVVARSKAGAEACGAGTLVVTSDEGIDSVTLDRSYCEVGDTITGQVAMRGTPSAGSVLRIRIRDSYGRVIHVLDLKADPDRANSPFAYIPTANATIELRAEAALLVGGVEVDMRQAIFTVPKRRHGQMNFVQWDTPRDVLGYYAWKQMKAAGMGVCLLGSMGAEPTAQPAVLRASDISLVPYSTRILDDKDPDGHMKPVGWTDEPAVDQYVQKIVDNQQKLRELGVFVYSLGDEGVTLGCDNSDSDLAAYRAWLQEQYGTIAALNASWATDYAGFDAVQLLDKKDAMETARRTTAFARWFDRQAFARYNLMQFSGRFGKAYSKLDPLGLTGFEGTGDFGDDYDTLCDVNRFYGPYPGIGDDLVRSIYPRDRVRSNWMGYSKTADALSDAAWRMVMKGMDSIWWWMWDGIGTYRGYVRPTMDLWPATEELCREMRPVRQGLGDLLLNSQPAHSGIGLFYSVASALAGQLENGNTYVDPHHAHLAWSEVLWSLGLDFRYVTSATLRAGALDTKEYRVLILPTAQAISPAEAAAMRGFVEAGGTLLADVRPGIFDGHCKALDKGTLDDLFGIQRAGRGKGVEAALSGTVTVAGKTLDLGLGKTKLDPDVRPGTATAAGKAGDLPILLVNKVGAGQAILLNFQLVNPTDSPEADAERRMAGELLAACGALSAVGIAAPKGGALPYAETRVWRNGDALVFGTYRKMQCAWFNPGSGTLAGEPVPARIQLPAARHLYDVRAGKYLGRVDRVDARLRWGRANFYAALPYRLPAPKVSLSSPSPPLGRELGVTVTLDVPKASGAAHAVWVEVLDPRGQVTEWGQRVLLVRGGTGKLTIPIAYNDAHGTWRVRATELFSGQSGSADYVLR
ncbi:MAG: beta-galactosidase trimerization domain-containing protein [Armatimonadetes bacterium]|nr:beta-galactosidase trimerization domain-containing protein [Armatimonadota bacterium]